MFINIFILFKYQVILLLFNRSILYIANGTTVDGKIIKTNTWVVLKESSVINLGDSKNSLIIKTNSDKVKNSDKFADKNTDKVDKTERNERDRDRERERECDKNVKSEKESRNDRDRARNDKYNKQERKERVRSISKGITISIIITFIFIYNEYF